MWKILYVLSGTDLYGGATKSFLNMLNGLTKKNIVPFVVCPDKLGLYKVLKEQGVKVVYINYRKSVYPKLFTLKDYILFLPRLLFYLYLNNKAAIVLQKYCIKFNPDIIHTNVSVIDVGYKVAKQMKIPHIWHIREYGDIDFNYHYYPSKQSFLSKFDRKGSYTICITKDIMKHFSLSVNKYNKVIYNGILSKSYITQDIDKSNYILWAGRIEPTKGTLDIILAYKELFMKYSQLTTRLLIAGGISNNEYYKKILSFIKKFHLERYVILLGERKDISNLMQKAIALVVTSQNEGFGRITAEAMFNGCLVIGRNTAGTKEQFDNGKEITKEEIGLRYNSMDELVSILENILVKKNVNYDKIILNSQNTVRSYYTVEQNIDEVYKFYNEILS